MPRRPTPTALKLLQGNPGHRPINGREPSVACHIPKPPAYLDARGREEWKRVSMELFQVRMVTALDRALLATFCSAVSRQEAAEVALRDLELKVADPLLDEKAKGHAMFMLNLTSGKRRTAAEEVRRIGVEFGLTPSARSKMRIEDGQLTFDVIDGVLNQPTGPRPETPFERSARLAGSHL